MRETWRLALPQKGGFREGDFAQQVDQVRSHNSVKTNLKLGARAPSPALSARREQIPKAPGKSLRSSHPSQQHCLLSINVRASRSMRARAPALPVLIGLKATFEQGPGRDLRGCVKTQSAERQRREIGLLFDALSALDNA
jgi:hypothetical protein